MGYSLSRTAVILIVSWLCVFSTSEADLGGSCNGTGSCAETIETCALNVCNCSTGYFNVSGECKSSSISVNLATSLYSVVYGEEVTLTATITSDVTLQTVIWQKGPTDETPTDLDISSQQKYTQTNNGSGTVTLAITGLTFADIGNYRVQVNNTAGTKNTSNLVSLNVTGGTISVTLSPVSSNIDYGSNVTLTAKITADISVHTVTWQKGSTGETPTDLDISSKQKYTQTTDGSGTVTLAITGLTFADIGNYSVQVNNTAGTQNTSNLVSLNVTGGELTVITGPDVTARFGGDATINCNVTGPEVNKIQWKNYISNGPIYIEIDNNTYFGSSISSPALTINRLNSTAPSQYQCTASNPGGLYSSNNKATLTVLYGQFNDGCSTQEPCDSSKHLTCTSDKCLCMSTYYHQNKVCYPQTGLAPTNIFVNSTTSNFSIFWNNPASHHELVTGYKVIWRVNGSTSSSSVLLGKTVNMYTAYNGLVSGQLYIVNVNSHVNLTEPSQNIVIPSTDTKVRTVPSVPGPIKQNESNFAHNNLQIKWTAPVNTLVTKYEVIINDTTYSTNDDNSMFQFVEEVFTPGQFYTVSIVTISGTTTDVKRSSAYTAWIRITPTRPNPPTNLQCPQSPLDVALEISWTAPTKPNGLILKYQINVSPGNLGQIFTSSNETHKNVEGLSPEKTYEFTVQAVNDAIFSTNVSEPSDAVSCTTKAGVSGPPNSLVIDNVKSRGFLIRFSVPSNTNGVLAGYKILILQGQNCIQQILIFDKPICDQCVNSSGGCPDPKNHNVSNITMPVSYEATDLNPFTAYLVKVTAINGVGEGYPVNKTTKTEEEVPQKPELITASSILPTSLVLSWNLSAPSPGNTVYTIFVYEVNDEGTNFPLKKQLTVSGFSNQSKLVSGLEEYWLYNFKVNAATGKGNTTSDLSRNFTTLQAAPGQVIDLTVKRLKDNYTTASLSWSLPALRHYNGVLVKYILNISHEEVTQSEEIPVSLSNTKIERNISVVPETTYFMTVILQNNESMNSPISSYDYTAPAGPPPFSNMKPVDTRPGEHNPTENTITVKIDTDFFRNEENGKQVFFGIAVCEASKCKGLNQITFKNDWETLPNWHMARTSGFPKYRVTNNTFMEHVRQGVLRRKRSTGKTSDFIIGDDQNCASWNKSVYCNGPLSPGTTYSVIIFACTNGGCTYSIAAGPYETKKIPDDGPPIGIIAGAVVAVVVVIIIVGVAFVVVRRRNRLGETKKYTKGLENPMNIDEPLTKNIPRKRPIKLKELSEKVAEKHKDSNLHFAREYEDLKALSPKHPAETSELDENKLKNRYVNILPFDHSRVKLMLTEDDDPSTDFINANYLPGYKSQREYIATQGPIPGTIDDFWRMIWEQNVSIIVMLTLCKEEGRVKCEMYWPENIHEPKQYGDLVVETVSCSTVNFYDFRIFKIKLGDTTRSVKHFHFLQWKDFSANVQNDVMIDFIKNVRNHIRPPDMNGPVVVHCSAGVGRTGTYCALDHLFQFVDEHDLDESIDIFDLVLNLRERRMFMVQTEQQYIFIHNCLKDYLEKKLSQGRDECLYENQAFVADEPEEDSLYQNYSNQRTDL